MNVPETERGQARLFAVDLPPQEAEALGPDQIATLLGVEGLPEGQYEYFPAANLDGIGLAGYLIEGMGMDPGAVRADAQRLEALDGHVLILPSSALRGRTLRPRSPLRWIGTFSEPVRVAPMDRLHSGAAEGSVSEKPAPSQAAISGRVATITLLVLLALVLLMILIA